MRRFYTDASTLCYCRERGVYTIPEGPIGFDSYGRRKVTWQRDGGKIYVVCPGCGNIGEYDLRGGRITGQDIHVTLCILCTFCGAHNFLLLKGAAAEMVEKIRKDPDSCPKCGDPAPVHWGNYEHCSACSKCGLIWEYPMGRNQCPKCLRGRKPK